MILYEHAFCITEQQKLALIVKKDQQIRSHVLELLQQCRLHGFIVSTHAQALEWAMLLPFSVLILDGDQSDMTEDILRRLHYMREDETLDNVHIWIMTSMITSTELEYSKRYNINTILQKPLNSEAIFTHSALLPPATHHFYRKHDVRQRKELPSSILDNMPHLDHMLAMQVELLIELIEHNAPPQEIADKAHAVKSAALNLGYFRLAGLMGGVEHAVFTVDTMSIASNWKIISTLLRMSGFVSSKNQSSERLPVHNVQSLPGQTPAI